MEHCVLKYNFIEEFRTIAKFIMGKVAKARSTMPHCNPGWRRMKGFFQ